MYCYKNQVDDGNCDMFVLTVLKNAIFIRAFVGELIKPTLMFAVCTIDVVVDTLCQWSGVLFR